MGEKTRVKWVASHLLTATNEPAVVLFDALTAGSVPKTSKNASAISGLEHISFGCLIPRDSLFCFELLLPEAPGLISKKGSASTITDLPTEHCLH
jgi:hypothetical protein